MKKIVAIIAVALSTTACAGPHGHHHHGGGGAWFTPLIIGGAAGYLFSQSQNRPVQIIPQPGIIYQTPIPTNPPMQPIYQEVMVYNPDCACYQRQYRQIGWQ